MGRKINRLNMRFVKTVTEKGRYPDGNGLYLQVTDNGAKSWLYLYRLDGRRREMGLGSVQAVTLAMAREKALKCAQQRHDGLDPIEEREKARNEVAVAKAKQRTFKDCAEEYIKVKSPEWKNPKHFQQWGNTLKTYVYPVFGDLPVQEVDTDLISRVLSPIWNEKTETAKRIRGRIELILDRAKTQGLRDGENPARWKGHLSNLFASPSKLQKEKHYPALPYVEMNDFITKLRKSEGVAAKALEFQILTCCRPGEAVDATWQEIDLENKIWEIPAEKMKAERAHKFTLSEQAIQLLRLLPRIKGCDFLFPSPRGNKKLSENALNLIVRRLGYEKGRATAHGFRSSFRDWANEKTNYPDGLCEYALSHVNKDRVEAAYKRGEALEKRFRLLNDWAQYCDMAQIEKSGKVVNLK